MFSYISKRSLNPTLIGKLFKTPPHRRLTKNVGIPCTANPIHANSKYTFETIERSFSTLDIESAPSTAKLTMSEEEIRGLMSVFPDIVQDLVETTRRYEAHDLAEWYKKALEYNLPLTNKKNGLITVLAYKSYVKGEELTPEKLKLARILAWCVELSHCVLFLTDDMTDKSTTRRGRTCWYKLDGVGVNAVNDALLFENGIFELLRKHFRHLDCYTDLFEVYFECMFMNISGQATDGIISRRPVSTFDMDVCFSIIRNKSSSNFFYLPAAVGLLLAGVKDHKIFDECKAITFELGEYAQILNDYLDSFGNPDFTGKIGTDIQANKCSWLVVKCLELATPEQRAIMEECYGQEDPQKIARVRALYEEMGMPRVFAEFEEEKYKTIKRKIDQTSVPELYDVFMEILNHVSKRGVK
ncbi:farnesyl pyrophosphate synthase-like [Ceratitis capitata]|uniref:farnesyl pyrophosphate synthase-like n=1 Tax=Ceratitis capitata TaxID=7213 RepID=UPI000C6C7390|nr:farnesyl pyrophosphate synthase-like [Ceratitis capitata]